MRNPPFNRQLLKRLYLFPIVLLTVLVAILWQQVLAPDPSHLLTPNLTPVGLVQEPIQPIPLYIKLDEKKVALGEKLFRDSRLSGDKKTACISCHSFDMGGGDRKVRSVGVNGRLTAVNTPTVFNSNFNFRLNWDGRHENLLTNTESNLIIASGGKWPDIIPTLQNSPDYVKAFAETYPDAITEDNVKDAIATFEKSLYTPNSRFDQFLRGDVNALTLNEKEGYSLFKSYGCVSCHHGINVGGNMFQKFGVMGNYFADRGNLTKADLGRFNVTGQEKDRYMFRVPSLRNIELTAPYFHDGSAETLEKAVRVMVQYQLGRPLAPKRINLIVQFLKTLTGEYQRNS